MEKNDNGKHNKLIWRQIASGERRQELLAMKDNSPSMVRGFNLLKNKTYLTPAKGVAA